MVYKIKTDQDGNAMKFKARWVVQGFRQRKGIDYNEIYAPAVDGATIRTLLAIAAARKWKVKQVDFIAAFLNGELPSDELVLMKQSTGYEDEKGSVGQLN